MDDRIVKLFVKRDILTAKRKVTLVGWLTGAILVMLLLAVLVAGVQFAIGGLKPVGSMPAPPAVTPTPTETSHSEGASEAGGLCPASWTVWKTRHPLTGAEIYDAPLEVKQCVKAHYLEFFRAVAPRELSEFDPARAARLGAFPMEAPPAEVRTARYTKRVVAVTTFAADGLHCKVADYIEGGRIQTYKWPAGELIGDKSLPDQVIVYAMEYDGDSGRWKVAHPPGQASTPLAVQELSDGIPAVVAQLYGCVEE